MASIRDISPLATEPTTLAAVEIAVPARLPRFWEAHWMISAIYSLTMLGSSPAFAA